LANQEVTAHGYDEALLLDTDGYVSEGSGENVFIVKSGKLYTPDLASCLDGITRHSVITMARDMAIAVIDKRITRDEMYGAAAARSPRSCSRCSSTWSQARRIATGTGWRRSERARSPDMTESTSKAVEAVELDGDELPAFCPNPKMPIWSGHPRVYIDVTHE